MRVPPSLSAVRRSMVMSGLKLRTLSRLKPSPKNCLSKTPGAFSSKGFQTVWEEMVKHVLNSRAWSVDRKYSWFDVHNVVAELMGIRSAIRLLGKAKHAPLVEAMAPLYERWAETWMKHSDLVSSFMYFLSTESGSVLLPTGMRHLAEVLGSFSDFEWKQECLTDALSAAVRVCWTSLQVAGFTWNLGIESSPPASGRSA